jgi:hypothetical protein
MFPAGVPQWGPMVRADDYRRLLDECTYRGDKVR